MVTYIGIDFGGTHIRGALISEEGKILTFEDKKTPATEGEILQLIEDTFRSLSREDTKGLGIGIAGPIEKASRKIYPPNIQCLYGFDTSKIAEKLNTHVNVENDANCFALAESRFGAGKGYENAIFVTIGTGIGGGILVDGKILYGKDGAAGEIGHMIVDAFSEEYSSGVKGSLENMASGTAIARRAGIDSGKAAENARDGDEKSRESFSIAGRYLGAGLATLANIFNPEAIVIGGSVSLSRDLFEKDMQDVFKERCRKPADNIEIKFSTLDNPGLIGAVVPFLYK